MTDCAEHYQIFQRNNGFATVPFSGALPENRDPAASQVAVCVLREDDSSYVVPWTSADIRGSQWHIDLTLPEGGLYTLDARVLDRGGFSYNSAERIKLVYHVGVGELYLMTGQSNMSGYGRDAAYDPPMLGVHLFANDGKWRLAVHPLNDSLGSIYPENYELNNGTCPALAFGRALSRALGVPVGLIACALGGSPLSRWHPSETGDLYRAMLRRLERTGAVGGVLWYQGCSDANPDHAATYFDRFSEMVALWRSAIGGVPFVTVQINSLFDHDASLTEDRCWGMVREAQRQSALRLDQVYIVSSADLPMSDTIHNSSVANVALGERMARAALRHIYGVSGGCDPMQPQCAERIDAETVRLVFDPTTVRIAPLNTRGVHTGFDAEDADGLVACIQVESDRNALLLRFARPLGACVRLHGFWRCRMTSGVVKNSYNMPMLAFYGFPVRSRAR